MSVAERTREAVRAEPFLRDALAAGVVNYAAAAKRLEVDAGADAVATALRRYANELPDGNAVPADPGDLRVRLTRGIQRASETDDPILVVGGDGYCEGDGGLAGVTARGSGVDTRLLERTLARCRTEHVSVTAAAVGSDAMILLVASRESATALRLTESVVG